MSARAAFWVCLALAFGLVFAFSFPPWNMTVLGFAALCGFALCVQNAASTKAAFWTGYAFGVGQFLVNFFWIANAFAVREGFSYLQGAVAVVALAFASALYPGFISLSAHKVSRNAAGPAKGQFVFAFAFALFWLIGEYLRGVLFTGFPWNPVGAMWGAVLPMAQFASVASVYGLSAMTMLAAALLVGFFAGRLGRSGVTSALSGSAVLAGLYLYGAASLPGAPLPVFDGVKLVLVQANIAQEDKWNRTLFASHVEKHLALSTKGGRGAAKPVIIWPETAYPYLIEGDPRTQYNLQNRLGAQATLIFGANRFLEEGGKRTARNALFVLQGGTLKAQYDKAHLVPFGEYIPLAPLLSKLGVSKLVETLSSFSKGSGPDVLSVPGVPAFAPMICYEGIFPNFLGGLDARPEWILNISNDAWFGRSSGPPQHLNLVRFRAIEQGLSVVRATGTGLTAIIDPFGRLSAQLDPYQTSFLAADLPKGRISATFFARYGQGALLIFAIVLGLGLFISSRIKRQNHGS